MGGYVDQGCININFWKDGTQLWLSCECPKDDGTYRTSKIDLNLCIGPLSGGGGGLEALDGYKVVTLTDGGGRGNYNDFRNWQLADGGRTFKCEGEVRPGLGGLLPWNWGNDTEWEWREFNLNEHLNNVNGVLEFWAQKYVSTSFHTCTGRHWPEVFEYAYADHVAIGEHFPGLAIDRIGGCRKKHRRPGQVRV